MNEVVTGTLLGIASYNLFDIQVNPSGREVWSGVRMRTANGRTRFFTGMTVEAEAAIILRAAMEHGDTVELWLSGKEQRVHPYGIRSDAEEWYSDAFSRDVNGEAVKWLVIGLLTLPLIGLGVFFLWASISKFIDAARFAPTHSRGVFDLGYEAGVLGRKVDVGTVEQMKAA
ncbi:hypothetical protein [Methylobacterium sp. J-092]|uniref:hypothetical protein n=1 Tax=Methylobacterium sp. J-092 TaxID=2836667 RepID=UPI001FBB4B21|nr:hypothetical protein [Methylobacterium sp. J-092]MCJ2006256.1 hypothetical protein [Methylobacterium sp. J-092]